MRKIIYGAIFLTGIFVFLYYNSFVIVVIITITNCGRENLLAK
jgi:hypothetical protein